MGELSTLAQAGLRGTSLFERYQCKLSKSTVSSLSFTAGGGRGMELAFHPFFIRLSQDVTAMPGASRVCVSHLPRLRWWQLS